MPKLDGEVRPVRQRRAGDVRAEIENLLLAGRYFVHLGVNRAHGAGVALYVNSAIDFAVFGGAPQSGVISLPHEVEIEVEAPAPEESRR